MSPMEKMNDGIARCTGEMIKIRDEFNRAVVQLKELGEIRNLISALIKKEINLEGLHEVLNCNKEDLDCLGDGYLTYLTDVVKKKHIEERMYLLVKLVGSLLDCKERMHKRIGKLKSRISRQGKNTPEGAAADKLSKSLAANVDIIEKRIVDCLEMFFKSRRALFNKAIGASEMLIQCFLDKDTYPDPILKNAYQKAHSTDNIVREMETLYSKAMRGAI